MRDRANQATTKPASMMMPTSPAARRGDTVASVVMPTTPTSPSSDAPRLDTGSGDVLTASLMPAFVRCESRAVTPPTAASEIVSRSPLAPAMRAPMRAPATGRTTVETVSHAEST